MNRRSIVAACLALAPVTAAGQGYDTPLTFQGTHRTQTVSAAAEK